MTIDEVYDKYKHLDPVLSEPGFVYGLAGRVLYALWKAVKVDVAYRDREKNKGCDEASKKSVDSGVTE